MKIQCNSCEVAEANVLCCADEAALCWACDVKVHAANKLASKHQRIPLSTSSSSQIPKCDICQEAVGYFFCLEDRALLCRKCDVSIHTANAYVSSHQRFLLTGVKVGLEPTQPVGLSTKEKSDSVDKTVERESQSVSRKDTSVSWNGRNGEILSRQPGGDGGLHATKLMPEWPLDDFFGLTDFTQNFGYMDNGTSKADSGKTGESGFSPTLQVTDEDFDMDECFGSHLHPLPLDSSGQKASETHQITSSVPDVSFSNQRIPQPIRAEPYISNPKRQRQY
ncbi:hypothetical protein MKW92_016259 [Papaver armeniacum]|nr:hypothetical protein MKW92_016259 [Papaver armeniacum]